MKDQSEAGFSTEIDYRKRVNQAMAFIQDNLGREISIREVAGSANFSSFHFHRIFRAFVGETLGDYMNRARMVKAVSLMNEGLNAAEAAKGVGYQTASAFTKAFKRTFGTLPSAFREKDINDIRYIVRPGRSKVILEPEFRDLPAAHLWIVQKTGKLNESFPRVAGEAFEEMHFYLEKSKIMLDKPIYLGILKDFDLISSKDCRYDACVVVEAGLGAPPYNISSGCIQPGTWAVFVHKGPYDTLWQTWNLIYNTWYPLSGLQLRDAEPFEIYLYDKRKVAASELITEIHIPVINSLSKFRIKKRSPKRRGWGPFKLTNCNKPSQ